MHLFSNPFSLISNSNCNYQHMHIIWRSPGFWISNMHIFLTFIYSVNPFISNLWNFLCEIVNGLLIWTVFICVIVFLLAALQYVKLIFLDACCFSILPLIIYLKYLVSLPGQPLRSQLGPKLLDVQNAATYQCFWWQGGAYPSQKWGLVHSHWDKSTSP